MLTAAAARERHSRVSFPTLTGSPSQVRWAAGIRRRIVCGIDRNIRSGQGFSRVQALQSTREWLLLHTDAGWWIENRDYKPTTIKKVQYAAILDVYGSLLGRKKPVARAL